MADFQDRVSSYPNQRHLEVVGPLEYDSDGNLTGMTVDITRSEGTVTQAGTALNAQNINGLLTQIEYLQQVLFEQYFKPSVSLQVVWTQVSGTLQSQTFRIPFPNERFYASVSTNTFLTGTVNNLYSSFVEITITETQSLNSITVPSVRTLPFYISLYSDSALTQYVTKLSGSVTYVITSSSQLGSL